MVVFFGIDAAAPSICCPAQKLSDMISGNPFYEITSILLIATLLGFAGRLLRQPLLIMFLITGIIVSPSYLAIIQSYEYIELLSQLGVALLLFVVGLRLELGYIRTIGPVALATGLGQIAFTSSVGYFISRALGFSSVSAFYTAVALTFSSTIIIVKLLSDKKEIDSLYGRIAIGFLIVQDFAAVVILVALTTLGQGLQHSAEPLDFVLLSAVKGIGLFAGIYLMMKYVLPKLLEKLADSQEMLSLFGIAWAAVLGMISELLGFTVEMGALLAGVSLASTPYRDAIAGRLASIRDFLILFFFVALAARLDWSTAASALGTALLFSAFVLIGNPLIVLIIMGMMGYRRRTSFHAGLTVAQISEFSLILAAMGLELGHISSRIMGIITLVGVVTIFLSTYMIQYSGRLYSLLSDTLKVFERRNPFREETGDVRAGVMEPDAVIIGLGPYGRSIAKRLLGYGKQIVGVDFDPWTLHILSGWGAEVVYGDTTDSELYSRLPLKKCKWVVGTVRSDYINSALLSFLRLNRYRGKIALTATSREQAESYERNGAHVVLRPFQDAAQQASELLLEAMTILPGKINWPVTFREIRIPSRSVFSGRTLGEIPLPGAGGAYILAFMHAGRLHYDPQPSLPVSPGDRLIIIGHTWELVRISEMFSEVSADVRLGAQPEHFDWEEVCVGSSIGPRGRPLGELRLRERFGVSVIGVRRGEEVRIVSPGPDERIMQGDCLIVIGLKSSVEVLRREGELKV